MRAKPLALLALLLVSAASASPAYNVIDLGTLGGPYSYARSINNNGQIVGRAYNAGNWRLATLFDSTDSGNNIGLSNSHSYAYSINNNGQIAGAIRNSSNNAWATLFDSTGDGNNIYLGTLGGYESYVSSINDNGQMVGEAENSASQKLATLFDSTGDGNNIDLGTLGGRRSRARSINNNGQIVGEAENSVNQYRATIFDSTGDGNNIDLGTLGGSHSIAQSINNNGQIVGSALNAEGGSRATLFDSTGDGNNIDLGTLPGATTSSAYSINNNSQIVGNAFNAAGQWRATLFDSTDSGNNIDLNTLIDPALGLTLTCAYSINDNGWIVGYGENPAGQTRAFLLTPEPACELIPEEIASMQVSHHGGGVVAYDANLYVWTGYTKFGPPHYNRTAKMEIYDPDTDSWSSGADIPQVKSSPACFELNGKFYTVGGETNPSSSFTNTVHRYDPDTDTWVQMNNFPRRIWQGEAVVCCGKAYVFGGASGYGMPSSAVHEYNEASDAWIPKASMPTGVSYPAAVCFENKIWVFGGASVLSPGVPTVITKEIQVYDCATNTWEYCDDMPWKLVGSQAVVYGNDIWIFASSVRDEGIGDWIQNEYAYKFSPGCSGSGEWTRCGLTFTPPIEPKYNSKLGLLNGYVYFTDIYESDSGSERAFKVGLCMPILVDIDIKPGSCPNPLNVKSKGVLPVAILGSADFDVYDIDVATIQLAGVDPDHSNYENVARPLIDADECECSTEEPDGYMDLTLKFKTQDIVATLGEVNHDDVLELQLDGVLYDETPIEGADCVVIRGKHKPFNIADINKDGVVNAADFAIFVQNWLQSSIVDE